MPCPTAAAAIDRDGLLTGEAWIHCASELAFAQTTIRPTHMGGSGSLLLLTNGKASDADPSNATEASTTYGPTELGGNDVSTLRVDLAIPSGATCLEVTVVFASEQAEDATTATYNDGFVAQLDTLDWSVSGGVLTAPGNFALTPDGGQLTVTGLYAAGGVYGAPNGTAYDVATRVYTLRTPITPGAHSLYLSVYDAGDWTVDSAVFIDDLGLTSGTCATTAGPGNSST